MKKLIRLTLISAFSLQPLAFVPAFAGTNAALIFRTNDFVILPTNVWASNAAAISAAIGGGGSAVQAGTNITLTTNAGAQVVNTGPNVLTNNQPNASLTGTLTAFNASLTGSLQTQGAVTVGTVLAATNAIISNLVVTNISGNGGGLTNSMPFLGTIGVYPMTNIPASIASNAAIWFTPANGPNYVQLAINALNYPAARSNYVGGGRIVPYLTNFIPSTLTNVQNAGATNPSASLDLEAPAFGVGALIGLTNPVIRFWCSNASAALTLKNLIIASTNDQTNTIVVVGPTVSRVFIEDNCFCSWGWLQSNTPSMSPTSYGNPVTVGNLVGLDLNCSIGDFLSVDRNSFCGLAAGLHEHVDHGAFIGNFFTDCGLHPTQWTSASLYSLGCAVVLEHTGNGDVHFLDNHFYSGNHTYFVDFNYNGDNAYETGSYGPEAVLENDGYEGNLGGMLIMTNGGVNVIGAHSDDGDNLPGVVPVNYIVNGPNPVTDPNDATSQIPSGPFAVGVAAPAGLVRFQWFDFTGWYETGPGNCGFQTSPLAWATGGTFWHDESGKGISLNGSGVIGGNGSGLTNLSAANLGAGLTLNTNAFVSFYFTNGGAQQTSLTTNTYYTNSSPYRWTVDLNETNSNAGLNWGVFTYNAAHVQVRSKGWNGSATVESNSVSLLMNPGDIMAISNFGVANVVIRAYDILGW